MLNFLPCCYSLVSILECFQNKTRLMFIRGLPQYKILFSHTVFLFKEVGPHCILSSLHLQNFKHLISFEISINSSYHWLQQSCQVVSNLWRNRLQPKLFHQGLAFLGTSLFASASRLLVRVRACGVNPVDAKYIIGDKFPESWMDWSARRVNGHTPGFDFSGEVVKSPPGCGYKVCIYNCRI